MRKQKTLKIKPDISIIVPIYNAEKYLNKCIDSLIIQTKKELEFILINDGSTDNSEGIIKNYNDSRIKYFKNENNGIGKARNFGIDQAVGKYIMFLDSDDFLAKDACEILFNKAENENIDLVVCDFYRIENDKLVEECIEHFDNSCLRDNPELLLKINLAPWNKLYKTAMIKKNNIRFVENLKYEDAPFVVKAIDMAERIGKVDKFLNYYVIHSNSETTIRDRKVFDIIKIVDIIKNYFKGQDYISDIVDTLIISILVNYNIQQRMQLDKGVAMEFIDDVFDYLKLNIPNYRSNKYFANRQLLKSLIEKNKIFTKLYCKIYSLR